MQKKILIKDALQAIQHSLGRYFAIMLLMMVGAFAYTGLKITGPDMRLTGANFFNQEKLADLTVSSTWGLDQRDQKTIRQQSHVKTVEFGYYQDAEIKSSKQVLRIFSKTAKLSKYQLVKGRMPTKSNELAVSSLLADKYKLGSTISVKQRGKLRKKTFRVVGYVNSSEYLDKNDFGNTNLGNGQLAGYAVATKSAFASSTYQIARIAYQKTAHMSPYSDKYINYVATKQKQLRRQLKQNRRHKYQTAKNQLTRSAAKLAKAKQQLSQAKALGLDNQQAAKKLAQNERKLAAKRATLKAAGYPSYTVSDRTENPGYEIYRSNSERVDVLANVFPVFLFAIALLVALTTMTRFVEEERINIGTLRALGYSKLDITFKFLLYSLSSSIIGVLIGSAAGFTFLPRQIFEAYTTNTQMPNFVTSFSWPIFLTVLLLAILATTGASLIALRQTLQERPAQLLLPKSPKAGSRILLERITPLWQHLSFNAKVTARNLFRYKTRMLMTIFGVAGCTGLLVMGFGIRDSISGIAKAQYGQYLKYDVINIQKTSGKHAKLQIVLNSKQTQNYQNINYTTMSKRLGEDNSVQTIQVLTTNKNKFDMLHLEHQGSKVKLSASGVILSQKLAQLLGAKVGSTVKLLDANQHVRKLKVAGITTMYMGHYVFMNSKVYRKVFGKAYKPNAQIIKIKGTSVNKYSRRLIKTGASQTVIQNTSNERTINSFMSSLNSVIWILIVLAVILAVIVIYNLTNINVAERLRELSTIKVLGFFDNEVTLYIYRETIILSLLGIIVGFFFGNWLHTFIIVSLPPANAMFNPVISIWTYVISGLIPGVITALLALVVHRTIRQVDMLSALASID